MLKNNFRLLFITLFLLLLGFSAKAQCRNFTEKQLIPQLKDYLLNGRYHSFYMQEGDEILIFKTLNTGIAYKFIFGISDQLPSNLIIVIKDWTNKVLFDSHTANKKIVSFQYVPQKAERVKIYIKVPQLDPNPKKGCVGLVIGIKKI